MGWRSVLFGFAALTALAIGSLAQSAVPAAPMQPRYGAMVPPSDVQSDVVPAAAPTTPVTVAPAPPPVAVAPPVAVPQSRYSTMDMPRRFETVTVTGLRPQEDNSYLLGTGDRVHITVFNEGDLSGDFTIDGQGYVRLPLIGQIQAAGLSTFGLETRIAAAMSDGGYLVNPKVAVEVTTYRPFYIIGEVAKPGEYPYVNAMSAPNAIALAGGFKEQAVESVIWVRHQGERLERRLPMDETTRILPGDVIRVDRSTYWSVVSILAPLLAPMSAVVYLLK
jgi:protein involved in polysaccharide export with SLBB domain